VASLRVVTFRLDGELVRGVLLGEYRGNCLVEYGGERYVVFRDGIAFPA